MKVQKSVVRKDVEAQVPPIAPPSIGKLHAKFLSSAPANVAVVFLIRTNNLQNELIRYSAGVCHAYAATSKRNIPNEAVKNAQLIVVNYLSAAEGAAAPVSPPVSDILDHIPIWLESGFQKSRFEAFQQDESFRVRQQTQLFEQSAVCRK